jgi:hypothetical protein
MAEKHRHRVTIVHEYDVPAQYGDTDDPAVMLEIDQRRWTDVLSPVIGDERFTVEVTQLPTEG